ALPRPDPCPLLVRARRGHADHGAGDRNGRPRADGPGIGVGTRAADAVRPALWHGADVARTLPAGERGGERGHGGEGGPGGRHLPAPVDRARSGAAGGAGDLRWAAGGAGRGGAGGARRPRAPGAGRQRHARPSGRLRPRVRGAAGKGDRGVRAVDLIDLDRPAGGRGERDGRARVSSRGVRTGWRAMKLAVLGATGAVGQTMLRVLEERGFPADEIVPLASERSEGRRLEWRGREWRVRQPSADAFRGCQVALFSAGAARSREWAPVAAAEGAVVVDNSSAWR